jgi:NAD(P)-dependent dehydrogenase (short-subunit alcohol dehydrogenase family)
MNKVAFVTGASAGIGEATARALLAAGYTVFAGARRLDRMAGLAALGATLLKLDLTDDASSVAAVEAIKSGAGRLDVLVNNAGYGSYGALEDVPLDEARRQFDVNVFGLARLCQLVLPTMRAQKSGKIVNVTSIGGKIWEPLGSWYHATKYAVEGLSDCLRVEVGRFGVDVIVIEPGAIRTEWAGSPAKGCWRCRETAHTPSRQNGTRGCSPERKRLVSRRRLPSSPRPFCARLARGGRRRATPPAAARARSCCCAKSCRTGCSTG